MRGRGMLEGCLVGGRYRPPASRQNVLRSRKNDATEASASTITDAAIQNTIVLLCFRACEGG
jgi:hypothetical protein